MVEIVIEQRSTVELSRRRCVACGFADEFSADARAGAAGVPRGRPERRRVEPVQASTVRILDPGADPAG